MLSLFVFVCLAALVAADVVTPDGVPLCSHQQITFSALKPGPYTICAST